MKKILFSFFMILFSHSASANKDIDAAFGLCSILTNTNIATECDVSGWSKRVDARIDTSGAEARQICSILVDKYGHEFGPGWDLKIMNPYSGDNAVAKCRLS